MEILIESCHRHVPSNARSFLTGQAGTTDVILVTSCFSLLSTRFIVFLSPSLSFLLFEEGQELFGALGTVAVVMI
jgi:hypothetical protein